MGTGPLEGPLSGFLDDLVTGFIKELEHFLASQNNLFVT
jgi:hypothetical protein